MVPSALRKRPPEAPADREATGVPELTFRTANLAEEVALLPRRKSRVEANFGLITPFDTSQSELPPPGQTVQEGAALEPFESRHRPVLVVVAALTTPEAPV